MPSKAIRISSVAVLVTFWAGFLPTAAQPADGLMTQARQTFGVLPANMGTSEYPVTPDRVELGHKLFFDPRISADGAVIAIRPDTHSE